MRVKLIVLAVALIGSLTASTSQAVDWDKFWADFHLVKQRNNAWPQPFLHRDQQAYFGTVNPMIDAGWQIECTLADHHFDPESHALNRAGEAKLASILRTLPRSGQQIYVATDQSQDASEARMGAVREKLTGWSAGSVNVASTSLHPSPLTGGYAETNYTTFQSRVPSPALGSANVGSVDGG